jgi:transcriptional regulator with GAF, ATPase, and Fis domain
MEALRSISKENRDASRTIETQPIVGESSALREVLQQVETVARTDSTVLIQGETGTGKELIATAIHDRSRRPGRFVKLNVAAVPSTLLESELFGHERGAFTGAFARRTGRFELADHGTLFLDEIGELSLEVQPKLLRLLQEREYERLGGTQTLRSSARLIVATHRNLLSMVRRREFREDLYYRLNVFPIEVPPLRERRDDIPPLVRRFVDDCARKLGTAAPAISPDVIARLTAYPWPGNIRELQNLVERAMILCQRRQKFSIDLPPVEPHLSAPASMSQQTESTLDSVQRTHIINVLDSTGWVIGGPSGAAVKLGMKRTTLNFRLKKLGISKRMSKDEWLSHKT